MKTGLLLFFLFICITGSLFSQEITIRGFVGSEGLGIEGCTITLGEQKLKTDSSGNFSTGTRPGRNKITITATGYEPWSKNIYFFSDTSLVIELQEETSRLGEIVISGTARPVQRLESPVAVEVYSPQFLKKNPSPSMFESLQNINGVRPQINCSVCNTGDIHINGLEGPYTMVAIDGMPIVSSLSSVYGLFGIPTQLIDRIEIMKGPASSLYGSEAIGGLINIITRSPEKVPLFSATVMSTSWLETNVDAGVKWKVNDNISTLLGMHVFNYQHIVDDNGDGFTDVPLQKRYSLFNKWSFNRSSDRNSSLALRYFYEDRWGGENNWNESKRGGDEIYGESIFTRRFEMITNYYLPVKEKIVFNASATYHDQDSYYGNIYYKGRQDIVFGQLKWEKELSPRHALLTGLVGRYNYYDDNSTATMDTSSKKNRPDKIIIPGVYVQDEWITGDKHRLLMGMRLDHHPDHKLIFTPRIAFKYSFQPTEVLRINAGTGFRVVNLFTEDHAALTGARAVEILDELQPEKSYNVNLNYLKRGGEKTSFQWTIDASLWYTYFTNQIIPDYDTDPQKIIYKNLDGHSVSKGFSVNTEWSFRKKLKGMLGITLQDVYQAANDVYGHSEKKKPMFTESWSGTWAISYIFGSSGISADYTGNLYGPMELPLVSPLDPRKPASPVWSIQNLQLTKWVSTKFEFFGGIKNLLDWTPAKGQPFLIARSEDPFNKNVSYDGAGKVMATPDNPYALTFDPAYIYAANQGRKFFAGLRLHVR
jgi:outer membrane receptor for ferrienterochelin and colicins